MAKTFTRSFLGSLIPVLLFTTASVASAGEPIVFSSSRPRSEPAPNQAAHNQAQRALEKLSAPEPFESVFAPTPSSTSPNSSGRRPISRKEKEKAESKQDWMGLDKEDALEKDDNSFLEVDDDDFDDRARPSEASDAAESRRPGRTSLQENSSSENRTPSHILSPTQRQTRDKKVATREARSAERVNKDDFSRTQAGDNPGDLMALDGKKLPLPSATAPADPEKAGGLTLRDFLNSDHAAEKTTDQRGSAAFNAMLNQSLRGASTPPGGPGELGGGLRPSDPASRPSSLEPNPLRPDAGDADPSARGSFDPVSRVNSLPEMPKLMPQKPNEPLRGLGGRLGDDPRRQTDFRDTREADREMYRKARGLH